MFIEPSLGQRSRVCVSFFNFPAGGRTTSSDGARKMHTCIRAIEEVDKEALSNYDDDTLLDVGCERTKPKAKFEVRCEDVKG